MASSLVKKLVIRPGFQLCFLHAPADYLKELGPLPEGAKIVDRPLVDCDFVQLFVKNTEELNQYLQEAINIVKPDGLFWICYPKNSSKMESDLNRDKLHALVKEAGFIGVSLVSIIETWSAMRFRPVKPE